ncbi:MAG: hypothetical protein ACRELY_18130, partial [Polyangiaceae bacterium]
MSSAISKAGVLVLTISAALGLAACIEEPLMPAIGIVAAETSRDASNTIHVRVLVQAGGADEGVADFDGSFCAKAIWVAGTTTSLDADDAGDEQVVTSGTACGSGLAAGAWTRLDVVPEAAVTVPA